ncbi:hypothetical protein DY000_02031923 [Brassica cretica]|uniref:Cleavage/polyadenylation specificity factor A subunit C-terminal domain-containing protein n=1 Tax=Brassica cretica TaxID=69181 RepID=A0ABQ7DV29_BRACR|nr:hypothetical protein DY000_02031923 [Brassica cretica]
MSLSRQVLQFYWEGDVSSLSRRLSLHEESLHLSLTAIYGDSLSVALLLSSENKLYQLYLLRDKGAMARIKPQVSCLNPGKLRKLISCTIVENKLYQLYLLRDKGAMARIKPQVTYYYVIAKLATDQSGLQRCKISLVDAMGTRFTKDGKIVGLDPDNDLAVLKIDGDNKHK